MPTSPRRETQDQLTPRSLTSETPSDINFLPPTAAPIPLATTFKPAMKVLSRKPAPKMIAKKDPITGIERMTLQDDDDDDDNNKNQPTPEEIKLQQQRDREEKQRRYDEARAKIFGEPSPSSGQSTPGSVTPPQSNNEGRQNSSRGRGRGGRGRGGGRGGGFSHNQNDNRQDNQSPRPSSHIPPGTRELFDPSYAPKPGFGTQRRGGGESSPQSGRVTPREEDQIIRAPRGPDASGGGFGFAKRAPKEG